MFDNCSTTSTSVAAIAVFCCNCCFGWKSGRTRQAVREPWGPLTVRCFTLWETLFRVCFRCVICSHTNRILIKLYTQSDLKIHPNSAFGHVFGHFVQLCFLTTGTTFAPYFTGSTCSKRHPKHNKNKAWNTHLFGDHVFVEKCEQVQKMTPKRSPNGCLYYAGNPLGSLLWHLLRPSLFLTRTVHSKCSKSDPKVAKVTPKGVPKW